MRVETEAQVIEFTRTLAPIPRRAMRRAVRDLDRERGDIKALSNKLSGFFRLRVMTYRVIFLYVTTEQPRERFIRCVFAEHRSLVYTQFEATLPSQNGQEPPA